MTDRADDQAFERVTKIVRRSFDSMEKIGSAVVGIVKAFDNYAAGPVEDRILPDHNQPNNALSHDYLPDIPGPLQPKPIFVVGRK